MNLFQDAIGCLEGSGENYTGPAARDGQGRDCLPWNSRLLGIKHLFFLVYHFIVSSVSKLDCFFSNNIQNHFSFLIFYFTVLSYTQLNSSVFFADNAGILDSNRWAHNFCR